MRMAVVGGTGMVGAMVADEVARAGHEPVVVARSTGVDVTTGAGLDAALEGVEVVIDVSNRPTQSRKVAVEFFDKATRHLLAAGRAAGVRHHVALSIVGIDRVDSGYYAGKVRQEELRTGRSRPVDDPAGHAVPRVRRPAARPLSRPGRRRPEDARPAGRRAGGRRALVRLAERAGRWARLSWPDPRCSS